MKEKFLYGAAVQGIQEFIFQTNKLKDIVGASELVDSICTDLFDEFRGEIDKSIIRAAGNIKHIFDNEEDCKRAVREFPKKVVQSAPGITISQAVKSFLDDDNNRNFEEAVNELEQKLRIQRNKPMASTTIGLMGIERSRHTGLPAVKYEKGEHLDISTHKKREGGKEGQTTIRLCKKSFGQYIEGKEVAYDIEDITLNNDWIAIIHADGNGLGQIVQKVGKNKDIFKDFSSKLDSATISAAQKTYKEIHKKYQIDENKTIPIRPIVLGGDDMTVIIRGDMAIDYAKWFLQYFESETNEKLGSILRDNKIFSNGQDKLTACAGIAFIKSSFPFYYGYNLAESLCSRAKKAAKKINAELAPSCLMFHKVQDSFIDNYEDIVNRELSIKNNQNNISFEFGPYFLNLKDYGIQNKLQQAFIDATSAGLKDYDIQNKWDIDTLLNNVNLFNSKEGNAIKSHLRQWMTILHDKGLDASKQKIKRVLSICESKDLKKLIENSTSESNKQENTIYFPIYDMLSLCSIFNQKTKNKEDK